MSERSPLRRLPLVLRRALTAGVNSKHSGPRIRAGRCRFRTNFATTRTDQPPVSPKRAAVSCERDVLSGRRLRRLPLDERRANQSRRRSGTRSDRRATYAAAAPSAPFSPKRAAASCERSITRALHHASALTSRTGSLLPGCPSGRRGRRRPTSATGRSRRRRPRRLRRRCHRRDPRRTGSRR
ncbi:MAG: hypothetical protein RIS45_658 [Planctomycetota bacterium]